MFLQKRSVTWAKEEVEEDRVRERERERERELMIKAIGSCFCLFLCLLDCISLLLLYATEPGLE
jgi:hypothetical protein